MHVKIKDVAQIVSGYTFRGAIEKSTSGDVLVLQAKNIVTAGNIEPEDNLARINFDGVCGKFLLRNNDIVLVSRGAGIGSFRAAVFNNHSNKIIASSSVLIIRIVSNKILPLFLSSFLNSKEGQKRLTERVTGSYIKALLRGQLAEMPVPLPTLEKQEIVSKLFDNLKKQQEINEQKIRIQKNIVNVIFHSL